MLCRFTLSVLTVTHDDVGMKLLGRIPVDGISETPSLTCGEPTYT